MKKALSFLAACLLFQAASAQNGFYLAPSLSAGLGQMTGANASASQPGILTYQASIGAGYQYKNWRLQSAIQYFRSGSRYTLSGDFGHNNPDGPAFLQQSYTHLGIPLLIGYTFFPKKSFRLIPLLGVTASYNINAREKSKGVMQTTVYEPFGEVYHRISCWGSALLLAEYGVSNRISVFGGPTLKYMLSGFNKTPDSGTVLSSQSNYNIDVELGTRIAF